MDLARRAERVLDLFRDPAQPPWAWRQFDRVAPGRRAKVILLASLIGFTTLGFLTVSLIRWLNDATTARLTPWARIDQPSAKLALVGMTKDEVLARFGTPASMREDGWLYLTGRREGPALAGERDAETVWVTFANGRVSDIALSEPTRWGCMGPPYRIY